MLEDSFELKITSDIKQTALMCFKSLAEKHTSEKFQTTLQLQVKILSQYSITVKSTNIILNNINYHPAAIK